MKHTEFVRAGPQTPSDLPTDPDFRSRAMQNEKLASIGQIAAGVAHEINNPIGYLGSNLNALQDYMNSLLLLIERQQVLLEQSSPPAPATEQLRAMTDEADLDYIREDLPTLMRESQEGIERIRRTVQDLKDFSRLGETTFEWLDVHDVLRSSLNIAHYELKYAAEVTCQFGKLPRLFGSPSQLSQVFVNILLNAGQAIAERGEISISTRPIEDWIEIDIEDTGSGMTPEQCQRIFEPFYSTKPAGTGTGLGLSISARLISEHQGVLSVASEPDKGSCFRIQLPVNGSQSVAKAS